MTITTIRTATDTPATGPIMQLQATLTSLRQAWRRKRPDYQQRMDDLAKLHRAIVDTKSEIIEAISADFGRRSTVETLAADIMVTLEEIKHVRKHLKGWMRPSRRSVNILFLPARGKLHYQPLGVVGIVAPWNYPFQLAMIPLIDAIAAGNHVMVKPSEFTPRTAQMIDTIIKQVFPADRASVVQGDAQVGAAFATLPFDHLLFTGSTMVGRKVAAAAAPNLTPITLELGGKSPALISPNYPIDKAAASIARGKCFNAGQTCVAPDYVLVQRSQRDAFVDAYLKAVAARYPTLADNPDATTIINAKQAQRLREWLDDAKQRGVAIRQHHPTESHQAPGEMIAPTVLIDPPPQAKVMQEEIFGPLLPVISYDSHQQGIDYILDRDRPLAFYPFDNDKVRLSNTLETIVAGSVCVNDTLIQFGQHELPIGGVGASGMGHYHGHLGFLTFSKAMPVMYQSRLNGMHFFDPPYGKVINKLLKFLIK